MTFQVDGMARARMEMEVRTCKVYMWKGAWTVVGIYLLICMKRVDLCCLRSLGKNRKERVASSYFLGLFPFHLKPHKNPLGNALWFSPYYSKGNEGAER